MTGAPSNHSFAFLLKFWKGSPATWASKADLLVYCFVVLPLVYERERERSYMGWKVGVSFRQFDFVGTRLRLRSSETCDRQVHTQVEIPSVGRNHSSKLANVAFRPNHHAIVSDSLVHSRICSHPSANRHPASNVSNFPPHPLSVPSVVRRVDPPAAEPILRGVRLRPWKSFPSGG